MNNLPKITNSLAGSSYLHSDKNDVLFPRNDHPDTRTNAQWLRDMGKKEIDTHIIKGTWYPRKVGNRARPVICITTGKQYICSQDAAKELNVSPTRLFRHLNGHALYESVRGLKFRYA